MRRLDAYQQQPPDWTRIEMLLAAFDGVMQRLNVAQDCIAANEHGKAQPHLLRAQRIVLELYSGLDLRQGDVPDNMSKLYLFVLNCIGLGKSLDLPAAIDVLGIIRRGLEEIRPEAIDLEHRGLVPHVPYSTQVLEGAVG